MATLGTIICSLVFLLLHLCINRSHSADIPSLRANIETYFSQPRHHDSEAAKLYKLQARKFIESEFRRLGLETEVQIFQDAGYPDVQFHNVIGVLKGEKFGSIEDKILGVGAHYDTYPIFNTPGVDDNGAGVAAMLEVLRQVSEANKAGTKRQNTIIFASFDAEELKYLGGYELTRDWLQPYLERNYGAGANTNMREHGVIIMDTMMNFVTDKKSQSIPRDYVHEFEKYFQKPIWHATITRATSCFLPTVNHLVTRIWRQPSRRLGMVSGAPSTSWNHSRSPLMTTLR